MMIAAFVTLIYLFVDQNPVILEGTFGLLTAWTFANGLYLQIHLRRKLLLRDPDLGQEVLREMNAIVTSGLFGFLAGYVIWLLDEEYCDNLRALKSTVGLPWGLLLEGHGWW